MIAGAAHEQVDATLIAELRDVERHHPRWVGLQNSTRRIFQAVQHSLSNVTVLERDK